jgi:hypothetical protein
MLTIPYTAARHQLQHPISEQQANTSPSSSLPLSLSSLELTSKTATLVLANVS